jgi:hypothetical protein
VFGKLLELYHSEENHGERRSPVRLSGIASDGVRFRWRDRPDRRQANVNLDTVQPKTPRPEG